MFFFLKLIKVMKLVQHRRIFLFIINLYLYMYIFIEIVEILQSSYSYN